MTAGTHRADQPQARWLIVAGAALMLAIVMGTLVNGLSAFFLPMEQAMGWARADVALINAFGLVGLAVGSVVMGFAADRVGIRATCLTAVTAMGLGLLAASQVQALWQAYALFFAAGLLGGGALFAPIFATVGNWFPTGAGLAIGIAASGQALGQGGMPLLAAILIEAIGWRNAMAAIGAAALAILIPLAMRMREAPPRPGMAPAAAAAPIAPSLAVPLLSAAVFLCCTCMAVPLMHLMPLIQGLCIPATDAGGVLFVMLLAAIVGRVAFGRLCDLIGPLGSWMVASTWQTVGVLAFTQFTSLDAFLIFAVAYGFGYSGVMTSVLVAARALTPPARRASSMGIVLAFGWLGHGFGGFQGAIFFDWTGGYFQSFANASAAGVLNLVIVATLWAMVRRPPRPTLAAA